MYSIQIKNLTKTFNGLKAVNNLSLDINNGDIFGFLGPNGAGKTTTIKAALGLIHPDNGYILIDGKDIFRNAKEVKKNIGYLPEKVSFYDRLTGIQNLNFYADLKNVLRNQCLYLLDEFELGEHANKKTGHYSKGMLQRLGLARALLGNPKILFLDEPTAGLDPRGVKWMREKIIQLNREQGVTIFISSHILSEIQAVSTQVGIINQGVLVAQDSVDRLSEKLKIQPKLILQLEKITDNIKDLIYKIEGVKRIEVSGNNIIVYCDITVRSKVITAIEKAGFNIRNIKTEEISLEDVFMKYTGGG